MTLFDLTWPLVKRRCGRFGHNETTLLHLVAASLPLPHLAFNPERDDFLPHPLAIAPFEPDQFIKPTGGLEEGVCEVEREGQSRSHSAGFSNKREADGYRRGVGVAT
jgi:hypothetical protein